MVVCGKRPSRVQKLNTLGTLKFTMLFFFIIIINW